MNPLYYIEDAQGLLARLIGLPDWERTQRDFVCCGALWSHTLGAFQLRNLKERAADPTGKVVTLTDGRCIDLEALRVAHRHAVLGALRKGRRVPDRVLVAYPELRSVALDPDRLCCVLYEETLPLTREDLAFLDGYTASLLRFSQLYLLQEDPLPDPERIFIRPLPTVALQGAWREVQASSDGVSSGPRAALVYRLLDNALADLAAWFQQRGYDDEHVPPPPAIDHDTPRERPGGWFLQRGALVFGQIGAAPFQHPRAGAVSVFLDTPGCAMAFWHAAWLYKREDIWTREKTEAVWELARRISRLTDWAAVFDQPRPVRRAVLRDLTALVEEHQGQVETDFVERFHVE